LKKLVFPRIDRFMWAPVTKRFSTRLGQQGAQATRTQRRAFSQSAPKTAVLMLNMGGPTEEKELQPFLQNLFQDADIIELGGGKFQQMLGKFISQRRSPKIAKQYEEIGYSPQKKWTYYQGEEMCKLLDKRLPESAPHKAYPCFRYTMPNANEVLKELQEDGVQRVVAFSQYPQWSCTTTGSSMNDLLRQLENNDAKGKFQWSVIDRWHTNPHYIQSVCNRMKESLEQIPEDRRQEAFFAFSAHSVPMKVVEKGDHYVPEVCASVGRVMERWREMVEAGEVPNVTALNKHALSWQSKVGFLPWMVPQTADAIEKLGKRKEKVVVVVPLVFVSDHIETLFELGCELKEDADKAGIEHFVVTEGQNGHQDFIECLTDVVSKHLQSGERHSAQYPSRCLGCKKQYCRRLGNTVDAIA